MNDLRLALRTLSKSRGFTLAAAGLLAAGIGVTTWIFSAVDAILLRPLTVSHPELLVHFVQRVPRVGTASRMPFSVYQAFRDRSKTLSSVFGAFEIDSIMSEPAPTERVRLDLVTPGFFQAMDVHALLGRTLIADDAKENPGAPPAVLSYGFWQRRFNRDPNALGKTIRLRGHLFTIVGVLPREFNGFAADTAPDVRLPLRTVPLLALGFGTHIEYVSFNLAGRLKNGVTLTQAQAEARTIWKGVLDSMDTYLRAATSYDPLYPLELDPLEHGVSILRDRYAAALKFLIACSSFLLLMVCANVAGLLLARGAARRQEIAVRLAVGGTRLRLAGQTLVESTVLAALGATGGVAIAAALSPLLSRLLPPIHDLGSNRLALSIAMGVNWRVLLFALAISIATVLLFGLAPAIAASRTSLEAILRGARSTGGLRGWQALILFQVALCMMLLTGAGLLMRTFDRLHNLNPGFDAAHVVTFTLNPPVFSDRPQMMAFIKALPERIRELPGVASVALAQRGVLRDRGLGATVAPEGRRVSRADFLATASNGVSADYFETMGIRLLSGRLFTDSDYDSKTQPQNVVVNHAFVQRYFPGVDPLGKRFGGGAPDRIAGPNFEIVGVVNDAKYRSLREPIPPTVFHPDPFDEDVMVLHVRTRGKPEATIQPVRRALAAFNCGMPIIEVDTLADEVDASAAGERLTATLGSIFAFLAVLLSRRASTVCSPLSPRSGAERLESAWRWAQRRQM